MGGGTGGSGGGSSVGGGAGGSGGGSSMGGGTGGSGGGSSVGGGAGGSGGGTGGTCGGFGGQTCSTSDVCIWLDKSCGAADGTGTCQARPGACPANYQPVCGCDGQVYGNECEAQQAGTDVTVNNNCTPPSGYFGCGSGFCLLSSTYCQATVGGAVGNPGSYSCELFPSGCGSSPSCSCLSGQTCGGSCQGTASSGLRLTCYAP